MDLRRLRVGEWIVAVSGVLLLVSLFLPYDDDRTAWEAFAVSDVILAAIAAVAVTAWIATATQKVPAVAVSMEATLVLLGTVAVILVLIGSFWLGLVGAVGIVAGAWISIRDDRMAGAPPPPEAEPLSAPRP